MRLSQNKSKRKDELHQLRIVQSVYEEIRGTIGSKAPETGGFLGGDRKEGLVTHYYFDNSAKHTGATYSPDVATVNQLFKKHWNPAGINLLGVCHSHPRFTHKPSLGDFDYARDILEDIPELDRLLLPIVTIGSLGKAFRMRAFALFRDSGEVEELELVLIWDDPMIKRQKEWKTGDSEKTTETQKNNEEEPPEGPARNVRIESKVEEEPPMPQEQTRQEDIQNRPEDAGIIHVAVVA